MKVVISTSGMTFADVIAIARKGAEVEISAESLAAMAATRGLFRLTDLIDDDIAAATVDKLQISLVPTILFEIPAERDPTETAFRIEVFDHRAFEEEPTEFRHLVVVDHHPDVHGFSLNEQMNVVLSDCEGGRAQTPDLFFPEDSAIDGTRNRQRERLIKPEARFGSATFEGEAGGAPTVRDHSCGKILEHPAGGIGVTLHRLRRDFLIRPLLERLKFGPCLFPRPVHIERDILSRAAMQIRGESVVVRGRNRIKLVIVATGAGNREPEKRFS